MLKPSHPRAARSAHRLEDDGEAGYMLLAVVVMAALVLVALSVAAPMVSRDLRRDKEVESAHRAEQYVRAVRLYYRKFNGPPPSMEALEKSNNIRFLRQQYIDPLTGKADWRVIHLGQQQTTIKVFGEELSGIATSGLGSPASSSTSTIGSTSALASGFSGASITTSTGGTGTGTGTGTGAGGTSGTGGTSGSSGSSGSSSGFGSGNIGPVVGVGSSRTGDSILNPNAQTTYDTWEFWYDPRIEQYYKRSQILGGGGLTVGGGGLGSGGINSTPASSFGQDATSGQSNSSSGSGSSGGGSTSGTGSTGTKPQ